MPFAKCMDDFSILILSPDADQYDCKTPFINKAFSRFARKNSKLSSAKRRWLTIGADGATP
jgi:hypothetical protein